MFIMRFLIYITILVTVQAATKDGPLDNGYKLKFIDTRKHPLAVCNDGSPGAYYIHDGTVGPMCMGTPTKCHDSGH